MLNLLKTLALVVLVAGATSVWFIYVMPSFPQAKPPTNATLDAFHQLWYSSPDTLPKNRWLGIPAEQNPMDLWITQEILFDTKPDFVVECGSLFGGSAVEWATVLAQINPTGRVISIDIQDRMGEARKLPIAKERVDFLVGSSTDPEIVSEVARRVQGKKIFVLLDSRHDTSYVLKELRTYSPMVQVGGYIEVQDTNLGHPLRTRAYSSGPYEAVQEFLRTNKDFAIDKDRERLMFTFCPGGFLKRVR